MSDNRILVHVALQGAASSDHAVFFARNRTTTERCPHHKAAPECRSGAAIATPRRCRHQMAPQLMIRCRFSALRGCGINTYPNVV